MKHFTLQELGAETEDQFHPGFLDELDILRQGVGLPFIVTSCARSQAHNRAIGGNPRSAHIWDKPQRRGQKGCGAIDIKVPNPQFKPEVAKVALLTGWSVGINDKKHFMHLDRRTDWGEPQALFEY